MMCTLYLLSPMAMVTLIIALVALVYTNNTGPPNNVYSCLNPNSFILYDILRTLNLLPAGIMLIFLPCDRVQPH